MILSNRIVPIINISFEDGTTISVEPEANRHQDFINFCGRVRTLQQEYAQFIQHVTMARTQNDYEDSRIRLHEAPEGSAATEGTPHLITYVIMHQRALEIL